MLVLLLPFALGSTIVGITIFLVFYLDIRKLTNTITKRPPKITELPIITPSGQIVNSVEELDMHIEFLKGQLEEKEKELETSKTKIVSTEENLKRLTDTSNEVRKYYLKLKSDISKVDNECKELTNQIDDYKIRQSRLRDEVNENVKYYTELLSNIDSGTNFVQDDYELVKKIPVKNNPQIFGDKYSTY